MFRYIFILSLCFSAICLSAQTNEWLGGGGVWSDAQQWSLGQVPTSSHDVRIGSDAYVKIVDGNRQARTVRVSEDATLSIGDDAYLRVMIYSNTGVTFSNYGFVHVYGRLVVRHAYYDNNSTGIYNEGNFIVQPSGLLQLHHNNIGMQNRGSLEVSGDMQVNRHDYGILQFNVGDVTIRPSGRFYARRIYTTAIDVQSNTSLTNFGQIRMAYQVQKGIGITGNVENRLGGEIWSQHAELSAISVTSTGELVNRGLIRFTGTNQGIGALYIGQGGHLENTASGRITAIGTDFDTRIIGLFNNSTMTNDGEIVSDQLSSGYTGLNINSSSVLNRGELSITGNATSGISIVSSSANLINDGGTIDTKGSFRAINIHQARLENYNCGLLTSREGDVKLSATSLLVNAANWDHLNGDIDVESQGLVDNQAVIYDPTNAFSTVPTNRLDNTGIILRPQNYVPVGGQTYYNAFGYGGDAWGYVFGSLTNQSNGVGIGYAQYNDYNNSMYIYPDIPSGTDHQYAIVLPYNCPERVLRIDFAGPSLKPIGQSGQHTLSSTATGAETSGVYPNPIASDFQLRFSAPTTGNTELVITDLAGRTIFRQSLAPDNVTAELTRPNGTVAGIYLLSIQHEDGRLETRKLVFQ